MAIRIGIIGAGSIFSDRHFPGLAQIPEAQVVAIANRSLESGQRIADAFGLKAEISTDPLALIARSDIDAVMIGTWPYQHCDYAIASLEAGKHTFVQARMAMNLEEARRMEAVAASNPQLVAQICPSPMALKCGPWFGRLIADGYAGTIHQVFVRSFMSSNFDPQRPIHWRDQKKYSGLNAIHMGILVEDIHRWFGTLKELSAHTQIFTQKRPTKDGASTEKVDRPDVVSIAGQFVSGAAASFTFSSIVPFATGTTIEAHGNKGSLICDLDTQTIKGAQVGDKGLKEISIPQEAEGAWTVERDFITAIQTGGGHPKTTFLQGVQYMAFTEAVARSVETGMTVRLSSL